MKHNLVVDEIQLKKAIAELCVNEQGEVNIRDVMGVINNCTTWLIRSDCNESNKIKSLSVKRRLEVQLEE